jgi:hypothetical protein
MFVTYAAGKTGTAAGSYPSSFVGTAHTYLRIITGSISQHTVAISALKLDFFQTRLLDGFRASLLGAEAEKFCFFVFKRF